MAGATTAEVPDVRRRAQRVPAAPAPSRPPRDDEGAALVELVVVLVVVSLVGALFTGGMLQMRASADSNERLAVAQAQLHAAFQRLDREIRYADGISPPGRAAGAWYVEYSATTAGVPSCTQLRMADATGRLESRGRRGGGPVGSWRTLASFLSGPRDFARTPATAGGARHQQLTVTLTLAAGSRGAPASRPAAFTFTALNTSAGTGDDVCGDLVRS
ncbi:hypothetical protein Sya03_58160 [Spirilliplanes yamanashiensis]|uniref:Prepilin-type N-terminal cleavage/methylation domain-containing protein n=1 Tax=Spirilliplanes yamanashiensis TaxID=42233 RepID=A0A8J4DMR0_9ACTN|nr:hypothetical protein Sya03_58160 [Spirilliplanes yamanashiensis]